MEQPGQNPDKTPNNPPPQAIHHELRTADNSARYLLPKLQALKERNPNLRLLDLGCGSGTITATLARALLPHGHVTGVDVNPSILPRARAIAEQAGVAANVSFQQADVLAAGGLPFPDGHFDVVHCHQVLTHLPRPWDALREMQRVTKAGGIVAAREGDLETECVWPPLPGLLAFHRLAEGAMKQAGGSATAGRELLAWALRSGARRDRVELSYGTWWYDSVSEKRTWCKSPFLSLGPPFCLKIEGGEGVRLTVSPSTSHGAASPGRPVARARAQGWAGHGRGAGGDGPGLGGVGRKRGSEPGHDARRNHYPDVGGS